MYMLISRYSSRAHERVLRFLSVTAPDGAAGWSCPLRWCTVSLSPFASAARTYDHTAVSSTGPPTRNARPQALRRVASSKQATVGCRCAPRPPADRLGSGSTVVVAPLLAATIRISSDLVARSRHPTQVRTGSGRARASKERGFVRPTDSSLAVRLHRRRIGVVTGGIGPDVDPPAGQPGGQPGVLSFLADREGQLEVRHDDARRLRLLVDDLHAVDPGR